MYVQLRRRLLANPDPRPGAAPFLATVEYFDTVARNLYVTQLDSPQDDPAELPVDTQVFAYEYRPGRTRLVLYAGNGRVKTRNADLSGGGGKACSLLPKSISRGYFTSGPGQADGVLDATGAQGTPPYQLELLALSGGGGQQMGVSPSTYYPWRFRALVPGTYRLTVTDATGCTATEDSEIIAGPGVPPGVELRSDYDGDPTTGQGTRFFYRYTDQQVQQIDYVGGGSGDVNGDHYQAPGGMEIDAFLLPDGVTWRRVLSDGGPAAPSTPPGVYFEDSSTGKAGFLRLENLILFNPDTQAEQNGGALVEVVANSLPLSYTLRQGTMLLQANLTGRFDGLAAGPDYVCSVTDAGGASLQVPFALTQDYGLRWLLAYDDLDGVPCRLELWLKGYAGEPEPICGQTEPVILTSDGLNTSLGGQGDLPSVVGTSAELALLVEPDTFLAVELGQDRDCRCDWYWNGQLHFRGYVQPDVYEGPLLSGLQAYSLTATDGLAALKDAYMSGHIGQRLTGHWPMLHTVLHCLSRTGVALPLRAYVNRRDATMSDEGAPELLATTNRTGYWDDSEKNEPIFQRTVLDALCQALGGTLCQRAGAWEIRSPLETALPAPGRHYRPAGTVDGVGLAGAPTATIRPPGPGKLFWVDADQVKQVRPGWKSLVGKTDAGYLPNAFVAGKVFSDRYSWLEQTSTLRPITGWQPAPDASFPIVLVRGGKKGQDYSTVWPRSAGATSSDGQALDSPFLPLVAGTEAVPAYLSIKASLVAADTYADASGVAKASPTTAKKAIIRCQLVVDGMALQTLQVEVEAGKDASTPVPIPALAAGSNQVVLRAFSWYAPNTGLLTTAPFFEFGRGYSAGAVVKYIPAGSPLVKLYVCIQGYDFITGAGTGNGPLAPSYWAEVPATDQATGTLLVSEFVVQLRPQQATWDGEDNFRADGPGGTVRPTEALEVYHPDVPLAAGLYGNNLLAFGKGVGLADGTMSTLWARDSDLQPAPLFEGNVLDALALRAGASRLLRGVLRHAGHAPLFLLDSVDAPRDVAGRRFYVGALEWRTRAAEQRVSLVENGAGADTPDPVERLPTGARVTHRLRAYLPGLYAPQVRVTQDGRVRVRQ